MARGANVEAMGTTGYGPVRTDPASGIARSRVRQAREGGESGRVGPLEFRVEWRQEGNGRLTLPLYTMAEEFPAPTLRETPYHPACRNRQVRVTLDWPGDIEDGELAPGTQRVRLTVRVTSDGAEGFPSGGIRWAFPRHEHGEGELGDELTPDGLSAILIVPSIPLRDAPPSGDGETDESRMGLEDEDKGDEASEEKEESKEDKADTAVRWGKRNVPRRPFPADPLDRLAPRLAPGNAARYARPFSGRVAFLELAAGYAPGRAGDYALTVTIEDITGGVPGEQWEVTILARLEHPYNRLLDFLPEVWRTSLTRGFDSRDGVPALEGTEAKATLREFSGTALRETPGAPYEEPPFFDRWLQGFDDILWPLDEAIGRVPDLLSPDTAPTSFLPWLGSWVGVAFDERWPEMRRRQFLREAVTLYRRRGTVGGLRRLLEIFTGAEVEVDDTPIISTPLGGPGEGNALDESVIELGDINAFEFVVTVVRSGSGEDFPPLADIESLIDAWKPAHTTYYLHLITGSGESGG